jgi:hypothetical protein
MGRAEVELLVEGKLEERNGKPSGLDAWETLGAATAAWTSVGDPRPLREWLRRDLDSEGVPRTLAVPLWWPALLRLTEARRARPRAWPAAFDARGEGLFRAALRFSRPDGQSAFATSTALAGQESLLREWADRAADRGLATVVRWWLARGARARRGPAPPPLPAYARDHAPLAMLRADWQRPGEFVALDLRHGQSVEVFGLGRAWLGSSWESSAPVTANRLTQWSTDSKTDWAEWTATGTPRVVRTALFLRGQRLALFAEQWEGRSEATWSLTLPAGVTAAPLAGTRAIRLMAGRSSAVVIPIGLPTAPYQTERGSFGVEGNRLVLHQTVEGPRGWLPLLVSWDPARNRKPVRWRTLTITEKMRPCPPGVAFAARVGWGQGDGLLVYRSLRGASLRAYLGHHSRSRFLVARFSATGEVEPLLEHE